MIAKILEKNPDDRPDANQLVNDPFLKPKIEEVIQDFSRSVNKKYGYMIRTQLGFKSPEIKIEELEKESLC